MAIASRLSEDYQNILLIEKIDPSVNAVEALFSPDSGIIDSHTLMRSLSVEANNRGVVVAYLTEATAIRYDGQRYCIEINKGEYRIETKILINSAGLNSDKIAESIGIDIDQEGYRLKYCKGSYFTASPAPKINHLIYPVPSKNKEGLGIHATIDLGRRVEIPAQTGHLFRSKSAGHSGPNRPPL